VRDIALDPSEHRRVAFVGDPGNDAGLDPLKTDAHVRVGSARRLHESRPRQLVGRERCDGDEREVRPDSV
jgi:hypothetical protein